MTTTLKHAALGLAAALLSVGVYAASQDQNTSQTPPPFRGGRGAGRFGGPGGGPGGPMGMLPMLAPELQLTDAQRDQVKTIVDSHRDEWKALADRSRAAHESLQAAVTAPTVDESLIRAKSADLAAIEADAAVARAHAHAEVLQILTADQKAKLKELEARRPTPPPSGRRGRH